MEIRADIVLQAVLKSFSDVILPALDSSNRLAQEQGQLMLSLLTLLKDRLPLQYEYDRDELARLLALWDELQVTSNDDGLVAKVGEFQTILESAEIAPCELFEAVVGMRTIISKQVEQLPSDPRHSWDGALKAVLSSAREQHMRERSWLLIQGWESDPDSVPTIETLIRFKNIKAPAR
ncbi:hypothetical protein [Haliea sp.]|jgi:hypothetical protein|uniref:hypothetical protein n=1 Tax=Haliea sp. TaxID=1932666 RepID=UPI000C4D71C1|nr:hypothetical protein [Haliea sp.]HCD56581.1 hypothetical protein [Halieaceae bacterium]MAD62142.1 hypothetical protein [Haliea sp.]MAY93855.1 hypothetical protein [Haliea sp.]MBK41614.1 hypothetical protein [Haliea sp.]MBP70876.1 hypothetical protein [Haliea sp.]|tara:strand:- start:9492 stop:10025 length:534 start_codon:yes stop_codon:yes gene_type:complete